MNDSPADIAPCFLICFSDGSDSKQYVDHLAERIRSDGTSVEVLSGREMEAALSLDRITEDTERAQAIAYVLVRLQKHGVVPIVRDVDFTAGMAGTIRENLEKNTFVVGSDGVLEGAEADVFHIDDPSAVDESVGALYSNCEERGIFEGSVSDHRSDEEVTDRLKNLGYI